MDRRLKIDIILNNNISFTGRSSSSSSSASSSPVEQLHRQMRWHGRSRTGVLCDNGRRKVSVTTAPAGRLQPEALLSTVSEDSEGFATPSRSSHSAASSGCCSRSDTDRSTANDDNDFASSDKFVAFFSATHLSCLYTGNVQEKIIRQYYIIIYIINRRRRALQVD